MKVYDSRNSDVVKEFTDDLKRFLNDAKSLDGMKIPDIESNMGGVYAPTKRWGVIEEGKIYLSVNESGSAYLVTRIKVIPKFRMSLSANKGLPQDRIAWASLRYDREENWIDRKKPIYRIDARNPEDKVSVLGMSNGTWGVSQDFWLYAKPIYIGDLYAMPFGFMNWKGNPLP